MNLFFIIAILISFISTNNYEAKPIYARYFKQTYGYMPSCNACHKEGGGSALSSYGEAFKKAGNAPDSFEKISKLDSDADTINNETESKAKSNPGDKNSTPGSPGNWLDTGNLVPKEVQAQFPNIRSWLLKDAILTPADIETGKKMGATLNPKDENTIYVPVENNLPVGTSLILPIEKEGKTFYLLLSTDTKLTVKEIKILDAKNVPSAKNDSLYKNFPGKKQDQIIVPSGNTLESIVSQSIKNALILLYVRLKSA